MLRRATPIRRFTVRGSAAAAEKLAVLPFGTVAKLWEELERIANQAGALESFAGPAESDEPIEQFVEADGLEARYRIELETRTILILDIERKGRA